MDMGFFCHIHFWMIELVVFRISKLHFRMGLTWYSENFLGLSFQMRRHS